MAMRLFLDTNVFIDALAGREPYRQSARMILALGKLGEFELWMSAAQATNVFYILSDGGKASAAERAKQQLTHLRTFVHACSLVQEDIDRALGSTWRDFEDACINQAMHKVHPHALVTGNVKDFALSDFPVFDCNSLFEWLKEKHGITYGEVALP